MSSASQDLRTAVIGVSGYSGAELARLLLRHPRLQAKPPLFLGRMGADAESVALIALHPQLSGLPNADSASITGWDWQQLQREGVELVFLATPHEQSREWVPEALAHGLRVVDLSGAWRLHEDTNRAIYNLHDADSALANDIQAEAVYGSPELHGPAITRARIVANPGCYATSIILALAPLLRANLLDLDCGIICDAKSGVSGAGKAPTANTHFMYAADNLSAYAVFGHRHTGELLEQLQLTTDQIQIHAAPSANPTRHPVDDLRPSERSGNDGRPASLLRHVLRRRATSPRTPLPRSSADTACGPHELLRHRLLAFTRMASAS